MGKYRIIAICDPYNAKRHYNGQEILRSDGTTPVEWVIQDGMTEMEALDELWKMALGRDCNNCNWHYENAESIEYMTNEVANDAGIDLNDARNIFDWFMGEGIYTTDSNDVVILKGGHSYVDDVMTYRVEHE